MNDSHRIECELAVIGCGLAGSAAALFASNRGIDTVLVGETGATTFVSGFLDLLGVHPAEALKIWSDPWAGIEALIGDLPRHPYALVGQEGIRSSWDEFLGFLDDSGLPYIGHPGRNLSAPTSMGTVKPTCAVPYGVWGGVQCLEEQRPCQIVDVRGLKTFCAAQIAACLRDRWPGLKTASVNFPETLSGAELYAEQAAWSLDSPAIREQFAETLLPEIQPGVQAVGLPPILGMNRNRRVMTDLEERLGLPVFEISGPMLGVPGLRLQYAFQRGLRRNGVRIMNQRKVESARDNDGGIELSLKGESLIQAKSVVLASGRFMSSGLVAEPNFVREPIFDLPVHFPPARSQWHERDFFDPHGHAVNQAGIEIDHAFRPVDDAGKPVRDGLFVAGAILAHHDWMRMKTGAGVAIATAGAAVNSFMKLK